MSGLQLKHRQRRVKLDEPSDATDLYESFIHFFQTEQANLEMQGVSGELPTDPPSYGWFVGVKMAVQIDNSAVKSKEAPYR